MFNFPTHQEMQQIQAQRKANGDAVRMMHDEGDKPEAGHYYTVSPSFRDGDRSWCDDFWEVVSIHGPNAFVRIHDYRKVERFEVIAERHWYLADEAWKARSAP